MLVLSRREGQSVCVGDKIVVTVLGTQKGRVRFGIEATPDVQVDRHEVYRRKRAEREVAPIVTLSDPPSLEFPFWSEESVE